MTINKEIQRKMHALARISKDRERLAAEIDEYIESRGYDPRDFHRRKGTIRISLLKAGIDITEEFVEAAKNDFKDQGIKRRW